LVFPEANSVGLGLMGGGTLSDAHTALEAGEAQTLVILENDLYRRAEPAFVEALLAAAQHVVVIDHLESGTTPGADLILPAATFAEGDGTLVNNEGRAQRYYQVYAPEDGESQESWRWLRDGIQAAVQDTAQRWDNLDEVNAALAGALPAFQPVLDVAPPAGFRIAGQKIPREPHRYSGRTAMRAQRSVHEPKPPDDPDTPLSFSMEGFKGRPPGALAPRYWAPGWNSVQALNRFQEEIAGPLRGGDPGQRLITPGAEESGAYFEEIPEAFATRHGAMLAVPLYHIFGSEELSILTPGVAELAPDPYLALGPTSAAALEVRDGDEVKVEIGGANRSLPVRITPSLPAGLAGVPYGLPEMPYAALPAWIEPGVSEDGG
ncbi:MAG: molybdopterin-dependent oxidoreductase, partial [Candidatus Promineifilaceae bacterium]|nr:molybdopterin-dependent oxidoreductase [Candidatus Promineifilaceae bacterium]